MDDQLLARAEGALASTINLWDAAELAEVKAYMDTHTWLVCKADKPDEVDTSATYANAKAIADAIGINTKSGASITSNHMRGTAVDWSLTSAQALVLPLGPDCSRPAAGTRPSPARRRSRA